MINTVQQGSERQPAGGAANWASRLGAILRRHWLAARCSSAGLVLRVLVALAYRPAIFYQDTTRYLYQAQGNDPVGYRVPLRGILLIGNFDTVAAVQHLLGLGMAVALYCLLQRRGVARWLAALAIAPVLLDAYQLQVEQMIMPDVWFEALIVAGLTVLLWQPGQSLSWRRAVTAGLVLGATVPVRQVGEILILPALCYVLVSVPGWRTKLARGAVLCAAFAVPFLAYCTTSYVAKGSFSLSHTGETTTYGRMAYAADCATLNLTAAQRPLCPDARQQSPRARRTAARPSSPLKPVYRQLPHAQTPPALVESIQPAGAQQQPGRVLVSISRDFIKLVRGQPRYRARRRPDLALAVPAQLPVHVPARFAVVCRSPPASSAADCRGSGGRWRSSCAPTSSTAAIRPALAAGLPARRTGRRCRRAV